MSFLEIFSCCTNLFVNSYHLFLLFVVDGFWIMPAIAGYSRYGVVVAQMTSMEYGS